MLDTVSKAFFTLLARSRVLKHLASRYGMRRETSAARRFIPGETLDDAISAGRALAAQGLLATFDHLGEGVATRDEAASATREYLDVIGALIAAGVDRNISLKLTALGLDIDRATAVDNLRRILELAEPAGFFIRVDMESSSHVAVTLDVFETLWQQGYRQIGAVLQSALYRSEQDLERLSALGARIRLVKGAYREPKAVAHQRKADVDAAYARMMKRLLTGGTYPAIATHDPVMIEQAKRWAADGQIAASRFEFQMLYGIRRDLQSALVKAGYRVRIYVPFGREWFPYFMRRFGEHPANVWFVLRGIATETRSH
jgi:proline dehydrogenase